MRLTRLNNVVTVGALAVALLLPTAASACSSSPVAVRAPAATQPAGDTAALVATAIELNVSAATSLSDSIKEISELYMRTNPHASVICNFASPGTIQQQIANGAPIDVFLSADEVHMDALQKAGLILGNSRKNLLGNSIVLIVPKTSLLNISDFDSLMNEKVKKVAVGNPKTVAAGIYAQQIFDKKGITAAVTPKLVLAGYVRQVLAYVESGDVDAGVVFLTDARLSDKVTIVANGPADINSAIVYPVAVVKASRNVDAALDYERFLFSHEAKAVFERFGFALIGGQT